MEKILILGHTGKLGRALCKSFKKCFKVIGKNSGDFDAADFNSVKKIINSTNPQIIINTTSFMGIDACEDNPEKAYKINTLFPKYLAEYQKKKDYLLIHFSTDAVFNGNKKYFYYEDDIPSPLNVYGLTKLEGETFIKNISKKYYIIRVPLLFGKTNKKTQFVEKILERIKKKENEIKIADDIILSYGYTAEIARYVRYFIAANVDYGIYHLANSGKASLYEFILYLNASLKSKSRIIKASYMDFPHKGIKNTYTPLASKKIPPLIGWQEAVFRYVRTL